MTMIQAGRKRNILLMGLFCAASFCQTSHCFVAFNPPHHHATTTSLQATSVQQQHLSHEEQHHLLSLAVEARRLRQAQLTTPSRLQLAQTCGYDSLSDLQDALDVGAQARETLVTTNMGLVYFAVQEIAKTRRLGSTVSKEDMVQEGAIGLARAVDRWNLEIGGKFSTYALYWIRALILRYLAERNDVLRVPEHVNLAVSKVTKAARTLGVGWSEAQAAKALAEEAGLSDRQLNEALKVKQRQRMGALSFESWMQQGRDLQSDTPGRREDEGASALEREDFTRVLSRFLRPKEMEALSWRYGLIQEDDKAPRNYVAEAEEHLFGSTSDGPTVKGRWGEAMSFNEVGKRMHVSAEYGRKLCHRALEKLRRAAEEGTLEPAWMF